MKNYNRYIILLFITTFISCAKLLHIKDELIIYVKNNLDKEFVVICETNVGSKELYIDKQGNDSLSFYSERIQETGSLEIHKIELAKRIYLSDLKLYNLTDTTYSIYSEICQNEVEEEIYRNHIKAGERITISEFNYIDREYFTIDSTLLPIFKKDYGMLEQFSEYYK